MQETNIGWTDFSSNLLKYRDALGNVVHACVRISEGCRFCYACALAGRFGRNGKDFTAENMKALTPYFDTDEAAQILKSRKIAGKKVFVDDMTDLFGEWVSNEIIDQHFAVFAMRPDVTFQILTKRAERMHDYLSRHDVGLRWAMLISDRQLPDASVAVGWSNNGLPNVHLGVSVEDQKNADERIPLLLETPAVIRWASVEPLLSNISLDPAWCPNYNTVYEQECFSTRGEGVSGRAVGRVGDRRAGTDLAIKEAWMGSLEADGCSQTVRPQEGRTATKRLPNDQHSAERNSLPLPSQQIGIPPLLRPHSRSANGQPQRREENQQPSSKPGVGNAFGADPSRLSNRVEGRTRREESSGQALGFTDRKNQGGVRKGTGNASALSGDLSRGLPDDLEDCARGETPETKGSDSKLRLSASAQQQQSGYLGPLLLIVIGGESGAGHRKMPLESALRLARYAYKAGVSVYFKQDSGPRPGMQGRIPDDVWAMKDWPSN